MDSKEFYFEPKDGNGFSQVLHWDGPGWYSCTGGQDATHAYPMPKEWDEEGFPLSDDDEDAVMIWDHRHSGGTPFWMDAPGDYASDGFVQV